MIQLRRVLLPSLVLCAAAVLSAQAPKVEELPIDLTSADLVKRVRSAIGEEAAWAGLHATKSVGVAEFPGAPEPIAVEALEARGTLALVRMSVGDVPVSTEGCDGRTAWEKDEEGVRDLKGDELIEGLDDCVFLADVDLSLYKEIKVAGKARQGAAEFFLVDAYTARGGHDVLTIDAKTFLPLMRVVKRHLEGKVVSMVALFSDYRPVAGVKLPHQVATKVGDVKFTIRLKSIEPNPQFDKNVFAKPVK